MGRGRVTKGPSKFDKSKCATCVYGGRLGGDQGTATKIICNYASVTRHSCLQRQSDGSVQDIRGTEYDNCKCYEKGDPAERHRWLIV